MNKPVSGSLSGNQVPTYQENRAERMPDTTFHTKGQLRKLLYFIWEEKLKVKRDYEKVLDELLLLRKENSKLISEKGFYLNQANNSQEKILELQDKILNHYEIENKPYMKVAD